MYIFSVNVWGVLLGAALAMVLGMIWYGPLFGKKWMQLVGMTAEVSTAAKKRAQTSYIFMTVSALLTAYVLAIFIKNLIVVYSTPYQSLLVAFCAWLGFIATSMSHEYLFNAKPKPWMLYVINAGYNLVSLLLMALAIFWLR